VKCENRKSRRRVEKGIQSGNQGGGSPWSNTGGKGTYVAKNCPTRETHQLTGVTAWGRGVKNRSLKKKGCDTQTRKSQRWGAGV